jgi:hypothetical protein
MENNDNLDVEQKDIIVKLNEMYDLDAFENILLQRAFIMYNFRVWEKQLYSDV